MLNIKESNPKVNLTPKDIPIPNSCLTFVLKREYYSQCIRVNFPPNWSKEDAIKSFRQYLRDTLPLPKGPFDEIYLEESDLPRTDIDHKHKKNIIHARRELAAILRGDKYFPERNSDSMGSLATLDQTKSITRPIIRVFSLRVRQYGAYI